MEDVVVALTSFRAGGFDDDDGFKGCAVEDESGSVDADDESDAESPEGCREPDDDEEMGPSGGPEVLDDEAAAVGSRGFFEPLANDDRPAGAVVVRTRVRSDANFLTSLEEGARLSSAAEDRSLFPGLTERCRAFRGLSGPVRFVTGTMLDLVLRKGISSGRSRLSFGTNTSMPERFSKGWGVASSSSPSSSCSTSSDSSLMCPKLSVRGRSGRPNMRKYSAGPGVERG
jgi:hypothetical protein